MKTFRTGAAAMGIALAAGGAVPTVDLTLAIDNLRSPRGKVMICVTARAAAFPDCVGDSGARRLIVDAGHTSAIAVPDLAIGDYAIAVIHDENGNGKLDKRLVIPREGFGFSRNPAIRFGPPDFADASFDLGSGSTSQTIRMKYIF